MLSVLKAIWEKWKFISEKIGNVISRVILTVLYFTIFAIPGIAASLFSNRLRMKAKYKTYWLETPYKVPKTIEESKDQG